MSPVLIWSMIAFFGVLVSTIGASIALSDILSLERKAPPPVLNLSKDNLRREAIRFVAHFANLAVGTIVIFAGTSSGNWSPGVIILILSVIAHILNSLLDLRKRLLISPEESLG